MRTDEDARAARAKLWVQSGVGEVLSVVTRLLGDDVPMWVNNLLCAYTDMGVALASCRESSHTIATFREAYPLIKDLAVSQTALQSYEAALCTLRQRRSLPDDPRALWEVAQEIAQVFNLPVACIILATAAQGDEPVILLQTVVPAPLGVALRQIQQSTRLLCLR